jgi:hypothetical protein
LTPTDHPPPHRPPAGQSSHHDDEHLYHQEDLQNEDVDHEQSDVNVRAILGLTAGLAVITAVIFVAMWGLFRFFESQAAANDPVLSPHAYPAGQLPPEPRLLENEPKHLQQFRAELADRLKGIDAGKKQLLEQGPPVRADAPAEGWMGTHSPSSGEASGGRAIPVRPGGK